MKELTLAVASGKGGTGKTTVAVSLAMAAADAGISTLYADCDVEEPNGHLFLRPDMGFSRPSLVPVPVVDNSMCTGCGECSMVCQYSAIINLGKETLVFENLCHGCGGCILACPAGAIREAPREIGVLEEGRTGKIVFVQGCLNVGEAMSPPLIRDVKSVADGKDASLKILDAPPGASCPAVTSVRGSDFVLLVTEPTPFGINDLAIAVEMVEEMKIPMAVVVNRHDPSNNMAEVFCRDKKLSILARIPDDRRVAEAYSRGEAAYKVNTGYRKVFSGLLSSIIREAGR